MSSEPDICDSEELHTPALFADLKDVGLWNSGRTEFLDYQIVNPDATSNPSLHYNTIV